MLSLSKEHTDYYYDKFTLFIFHRGPKVPPCDIFLFLGTEVVSVSLETREDRSTRENETSNV